MDKDKTRVARRECLSPVKRTSRISEFPNLSLENNTSAWTLDSHFWQAWGLFPTCLQLPGPHHIGGTRLLGPHWASHLLLHNSLLLCGGWMLLDSLSSKSPHDCSLWLFWAPPPPHPSQRLWNLIHSLRLPPSTLSDSAVCEWPAQILEPLTSKCFFSPSPQVPIQHSLMPTGSSSTSQVQMPLRRPHVLLPLTSLLLPSS